MDQMREESDPINVVLGRLGAIEQKLDSVHKQLQEPNPVWLQGLAVWRPAETNCETNSPRKLQINEENGHSMRLISSEPLQKGPTSIGMKDGHNGAQPCVPLISADSLQQGPTSISTKDTALEQQLPRIQMPGEIGVSEEFLSENSLEDVQGGKSIEEVAMAANATPSSGADKAGNHILPVYAAASEEAPSWASASHDKASLGQMLWVTKRNTSKMAKLCDRVIPKFISSRLKRVAKQLGSSRNEDEEGYTKCVHSIAFEILSSCAILLNTFYIGYSASCVLEAHAYDWDPPRWLEAAAYCFCIFFVMELLIRFSAERMLFFFGREWKWNLLDAILIATNIADLLLNKHANNSGPLVSVGKVMRCVRFARLLRIIRVMRHMTSLRVVVFSIIGSMGSLFWCFFIVAFLLYVFAIFILYAEVEWFTEVGSEANDDISDGLKTYYGSLYKTMVSLFMAVSGGADWSALVAPLQGIHTVYGTLYILYIFFMYFGVFNVVVGAFVATTAGLMSKDREVAVNSEIQRMETYVTKVRDFFNEADVNRNGTLTWQEFLKHMQNTKIQAYFQTLDLEVSQAHLIFELLDVDNSGQITVDEFTEGCMRLKGVARSVDVNLLMLHQKKMARALNSIISNCAKGVPKCATKVL